MKRSENSCSPWSTRIISFFSMMSTVVGAIVVAVAMQTDWPARHPSPKKSPGPRIATTACFAGLIHDSKLHAAFLNVHHIFRGITLGEHGLFFSKLADLSAQTSQLRNNCASKAGLCTLMWEEAPRTLTETRRAGGGDMIGDNSINPSDCLMLNSPRQGSIFDPLPRSRI